MHNTSQINDRDEHSDVKEILFGEVDVASFDWNWDAVTLYPLEFCIVIVGVEKVWDS